MTTLRALLEELAIVTGAAAALLVLELVADPCPTCGGRVLGSVPGPVPTVH